VADIDKRLDRYRTRRSSLHTERSSWYSHWEEITDYVFPRRGRYFTDDVKSGGEKKHQNVINNSASRAAQTLASGMMAGISSPSRPWFALKTPDPSLNEFGSIKQWLNEVERRMRDVFSKSNVYNALHTLYSEEGAFGTGVMLITEDFEDVIRCYPLTAGSYYLAQNQRYTVDTLYRDMPMTVDQLIRRFGKENCSHHVNDMYKRGMLDTWVQVTQVIEPRESREDTGLAIDMPYVSVYYETSGRNAREPKVLRESGFEEFPAAVPRWDVLGEDVYGTSPGMYALGDTKQLQLQEKRKAQAIDKMSNPPMVAPPNLQKSSVSLLPGGVTYLDSQTGNQAFTPAYQVDPRINELMMDIEKTELRIERTFFADLFQMLTNSDRRQITAREIEERHEEKLLMLGPVLDRQHNELLDVLIDRTFAVMARNGLIPEAPPELQGQDLEVEYISILAQAQKAVGTTSLDRLATFVTTASQFQPDILDKVDWDQTVDEYGDNLGVPAKVIRTDDDTASLRQQRQQAEQAAQAAELAQQGASVAKDLSQAQTSEPSALSALAGAVGG
jgi:hypothetical protein